MQITLPSALTHLSREEITPDFAADLTADERSFGNYEPGRYAWCLGNVRRLSKPVLAKGNRLLWEWKSEAP